MEPVANPAAPSPLRIDPARAVDGIDWASVFGQAGPVEIEVGIGKGRFLLAAAALHPEIRYLGIEWANEYLSIAESRAQKRGLANVRFVRADAKEIVSRGVPDRSVDAYYVFYPDPWPKKRHHKRRFFQPAIIDHLARTLKSDGRLHIATDHEEYWRVIEPLLDGHPAFSRLPGFGGDGFPLPSDAPLTNFESKYVNEGRGQHRGSWRRQASEAAA
jgi:tRNA (guanine-N7-)-methyltransferase